MRPTDLIRTSNNKQDRFAGSATRECVDRQIASLFRVDAAEKQKHARFFNFGKFGEKKMACLGSGRTRFFDPKWRNFFLGAIKPEGFARLGTFFFGSKNYRGSVAQDPVIGPRPVEPFFEMFERKGALEPGIEHAMRKNEIRCGGFVEELAKEKNGGVGEVKGVFANEIFFVVCEAPQPRAPRIISGAV